VRTFESVGSLPLLLMTNEPVWPRMVVPSYASPKKVGP
jgi:hypothetical protein